MPAPSRPFDVGQCATPVPVAPIRSHSPPSRCTQCASQTSSPSQPRPSRYSSGRLPKRSRQNSSSSSVSARCVCSRTPRARASSAVSRHQLGRDRERRRRRERDPHHRARRRVVEAVDRVGARGEDRVALLDDLVRRQPALALPEVHRAAAWVEAQPDRARRLDLHRQQVAARRAGRCSGGRSTSCSPSGRARRARRARRRRRSRRRCAPRRGRARRATRTASPAARSRASRAGRGGGGS